MKVLHILNTASYSGAEKVAITIINKMKKKGIQSIYLSLNGSIKSTLETEKIDFYPVPKLSIKFLKKALKEIEPDIIHAHDYTASIIISFCFPKAKIISHLHNNSPWIKKRGIYSYVYLLSSLFYEKILTVSSSIENEYVFGKRIHKKIRCIDNPIDIEYINKKSNEYYIEEKYDLIFLGRITESKNPELLLKIINTLIKNIPSIKIAIVGIGDKYLEFKKDLNKINLNKNVKLYGFINNPYPILKNSKIMCLPSKWEGYGLVAAEALSLGVPVVCSGAGGLKNIVSNRCGMLCQDDLNNYIDEIHKLLSNPRYYSYKHNNALKRSKKIDNIDEYIETIYAVYIERK